MKMNLEMQLFSSLLTNRYERKNRKYDYNSVSAVNVQVLSLTVSWCSQNIAVKQVRSVAHAEIKL